MSTENKEEGGQKLYAGKYKTIEALEEGYKNSLPLHQENESLKKKLEDVTKTPDDYLKPSDSNLNDDELSELKTIAKNSGLTQSHFDKLVLDKQERNKSRASKIEESRKALGVEKLNIINDYVKKHYPDKIGNVIVDQIIQNKDMLDEALSHREKTLNSAVPGTNKINHPGYTVTKADVLKARKEMEQASHRDRKKLQDKYIDLTNSYLESRKNA